MLGTLFRLTLACLVLAAPMAAHAQKFPALTGRVVDAANLLSPDQEAQLTQLSQEIQTASSRQFVVATIPDLQGYDIADFGYKLGREWKIGQKDANNGIILLIAPNDRKVRIEVGYGLEPVMTDAYSGMIIDNLILPKFRGGDMPGGIMAGAAAIGEQMKLPLEAAEKRARDQLAAQPAAKRKGGGKGAIGGFIALFWVFVVLAVVLPLILGRGRRGRRYRGGGSNVGSIILWTALEAAARSSRGGGSGGGGGGGGGWGGGGGGGWGGGGGGGFSGGGGSFGGGGASGSW
ncbi:MAG: YgcG family protein [Sphingomonas sp.]